jgi:hypothetical protein
MNNIKNNEKNHEKKNENIENNFNHLNRYDGGVEDLNYSSSCDDYYEKNNEIIHYNAHTHMDLYYYVKDLEGIYIYEFNFYEYICIYYIHKYICIYVYVCMYIYI